MNAINNRYYALWLGWVALVVILLFSSLTLDAWGQHSVGTSYGTETSEEIAARMQSTLLSDALLNLAESRELEIAYAPELLIGKIAICPQLPEGDEAAIRCILSESGLIVRQLTSGVYLIQKPKGGMSGYHGAIKGTVRSYETGAVLAGAHVVVVGTPYSTASSQKGVFHLDRIPPGMYDIQVSNVGYESREFPHIHIVAGQSIDVELKLTEATLPLDEVLITSKKKRRGLTLPDTIDALAYQGIRVGAFSAGLFMSSAATTVKGVQLGGLGSMARDSLRGVQFSGVFNSAQTAEGVQFGGVFNTVIGDLDGYQFSGVLNQLGGELKGGQFAGTVNTAGNVDGAQFSGIANLADGYARGVQAAGIVNVAGDMKGTQLAGIANRANRKSGFQGAGIMNMSGPMTGMQASGIVNVVHGDFKGVQAAGIVNVGGNSPGGVQLSGIVNVAGDIGRGVQIGVLNIANRNDGLPLGLVSYVKETGLRFDVWVDEMGMTPTALRTGNRSFSNYIGVAARPESSFDNQSVLFGLGGEFSHRPRLYSSLDAMYYMFGLESNRFDEHIVKLRWLLGFNVAPRFALFGGPSLNLLLTDNPNSTLPIPSRQIENGQWGSTRYNFWTGFAFGVRISTKP